MLIQTDQKSLAREVSSHGLVNVDSSALSNARKRREAILDMHKKVEECTAEMLTMKSEFKKMQEYITRHMVGDHK